MALHELGKLKIGFQDGGLEFGWGDKALRRLNLRKKKNAAENDYDDYQESGEGVDAGYTGRFAAQPEEEYDSGEQYDADGEYADDDQYADDGQYDDRYAEDDQYADDGRYDDHYAEDDQYADDGQYDDRYAEGDQYADDGQYDDRYAEDDQYADDGQYDDRYAEDDQYADDGQYDDRYADDDQYDDGGSRFGSAGDEYEDDYPENFWGRALKYMDENDWLTYVLLVVLPPVGIWLLWRRQKYELNTRYIASGASGLWFVVILVWICLKLFSPGADIPASPNLELPSASPTVQATIAADASTVPTIAPDATAAPGSTLNPSASLSPSASIQPAATPIGGGNATTTTSELVWCSATGMYYHSKKDCSLIDSTEVVSQTTVETATSRGKYACPECYNLEIFYATAGGKWYHKDKNCGGMTTATVYSKEAAEATGKTPCPTCNGGTAEATTAPSQATFINSNTVDKSGITVWANPDGKYYHVTSTCSNMKNAQNIPLSVALLAGKKACPTCCAASGAVVYCHSDGKYYHKASSCSGTSMRNGTAVTLAEALVLGKSACPSCLAQAAQPDNGSNQENNSSSEYYVYANPGGKYYHTRSSCGSMTSAERVTLKSMIEEGRQPCPDCASGASMTVYAQSGGKYYHSYATCSGMTNAQQGTLANALAYGLQRCPKCWGENNTGSNGDQTNEGDDTNQTENLTPFTATADNVMVWARADGTYYHTKKNCGTLTNPSYISLRVAVDAGKQPCPNCAQAATQMVFSTDDGKNYHTIADCRGMKNAERRTLAEAMMLGQTACPVCINLKVEDKEGDPGPDGDDGSNTELVKVGDLTVGTSGINVYAAPSDEHFHLDRSCSNATASLSHVALETALNYGKSPCSRCASAAGATVYATPNGKYYHSSASCAGGGASRGTLALAVAMGFKPCPYCVLSSSTPTIDQVNDASGIKVYATATDPNYHINQSHVGADALYVTLGTALKYGKTACSSCCAIANRTVYAASGNPYYHISATCVPNAVQGRFDLALAAGLTACPYCIGGQSQPTIPTPQPGSDYDAPANTSVYVDLYSEMFYYHKDSACSGTGMTDGTAVTLEFAKDLGYLRCPYCNPASGISD